MSEESKLELKSDGEAAVEATVDGTLKEEVASLKITAVGVSPPVKKAKKLPTRKPIKVEEAKPPFELPQETVFIPQFSVVEEANVEVVKQQVETIIPKAEIVKTEDAPAPKAEKQVKALTPSANRSIVKQLRSKDPDHKRTCASCLRRVPIVEIGKTGEICDACK